jgi:Zn-finger nucleic acid-binding protein
MICPKCNSEMMQVVKHGINIDTCTACGGVWLDKGELGELMSRVTQASSSLDQELSRAQPPRDYGRSHHDERYNGYRDDHRRDEHHDDHDRHEYGHKKRSIWDIFD